MRRIIVNTGLLVVLLGLFSCEEKVFEANFEDIEDMTIYNYLLENDSLYGNFLKILEAAGIDKTLSAYNPEGEGYTLFLPDSFAVVEFINKRPEYNTLSDLLNDKEYVAETEKKLGVILEEIRQIKEEAVTYTLEKLKK